MHVDIYLFMGCNMNLADLQEKFPFLTAVEYGGTEYIGIMVNQDQWVTSMYCYSKIKTLSDRKHFLELGEVWWWQSNRTIPISIFLRSEIAVYDYAIVSLNTRDVKITSGPTVNIGNSALRRPKKKNVRVSRRSS